MKAKDVNSRIERLGGYVIRQTGSHRQFEAEITYFEIVWQATTLLNGRRFTAKTTVPQHGSKDIPTGTLHAIQRDMEPVFGKGWLLSGK
jgi:predicted RNA binding protein YcfA (HicA-like mRNA interferase family)